MGGIDAKQVLVGAPDQTGVSGAVARAPLGTEIPETARAVLDAAFARGGYVSDEGVTIAPNYSTASINDWSGAEVRKVLESFSGAVSFAFIQTGEAEAKMIYGAESVTAAAATPSSGSQLKIALGARLPDPGVWVFSVKDGKALVKVVLPNAQPVTVNEIPLAATSAIAHGTELACYPDEDGNSIYILTDDGVFSA